MYELAERLLHDSQPVDSLTWQSQATEGREGMSRTWELEDVCVEIGVPSTPFGMARLVKPNVVWASKHFQERVGGVPVNPPPSHEIWPYRQQGNSEHLDGGKKFSHTYPERFWPSHAGHPLLMCGVANQYDTSMCEFGPMMGIRYQYGDLNDVVNLLVKDPTTRQAYLPVWFPEDTGAIHDQRVPCTLGYHFRIRNGQVNCTYHMRSCDYLRHMRDDVYLAMRLMQWICSHVGLQISPESDLYPGTLVMNIGSLHIFDGDRASFPKVVEQLRLEEHNRLSGAMG